MIQVLTLNGGNINVLIPAHHKPRTIKMLVLAASPPSIQY